MGSLPDRINQRAADLADPTSAALAGVVEAIVNTYFKVGGGG